MSSESGCPAAVDRFIDYVRSGKVLKSTEFASAVSVTTSNTFRDAGRCDPDPPVVNDDGSQVIILWNCESETGQKGLASFLTMDDGHIKDVSVMVANIGPPVLPGALDR